MFKVRLIIIVLMKDNQKTQKAQYMKVFNLVFNLLIPLFYHFLMFFFFVSCFFVCFFYFWSNPVNTKFINLEPKLIMTRGL